MKGLEETATMGQGNKKPNFIKVYKSYEAKKVKSQLLFRGKLFQLPWNTVEFPYKRCRVSSEKMIEIQNL